jgi:asparagine synthase (glutamine-hydrolysing)
MSVQFGRWSFDGCPSSRDDLERADRMLAPYGPDGASAYSKDGLHILFHAFHTTRESHQEIQPHVLASGSVLTWDGRLDNRGELTEQAGEVASNSSSDLSLVAAAFDRWGVDCVPKFIGDWALSIWNPADRSLTLARDVIGIRQLYYRLGPGDLTWSTLLEPLVLLAGKTLHLDEEYIAGWLASSPAASLTPYREIRSVPPASFVRFRAGRVTVWKYWDFSPERRVRYRHDAEYEEQFVAVFSESVRRRLRSDSPILAELSGGMDSSAIVCVADQLIEREAAQTTRLDTVSYYDDDEPNWDERPYFTKVEQKRRRVGCHIDVGSDPPFGPDPASDPFEAMPGSAHRQNEANRQFAACLRNQRNRVVLSGRGGDEVTGGMPSPISELADLLTRFRLRALARQLKVWALYQRRPWFHLFWETLRSFSPGPLLGTAEIKRSLPWLDPHFARAHRPALLGYRHRFDPFGPRPSFQAFTHTIDGLRRRLGAGALPEEPTYEIRYPFLDRDLLEFLAAVPREQLVRPRHRRSLMRRALTEIVPPEILNRKRKAFVSRAPIVALTSHWQRLEQMSLHMASGPFGIVDTERFVEIMHTARGGGEVSVVALLRMLRLEAWLTDATRTRSLAEKRTRRRALV